MIARPDRIRSAKLCGMNAPHSVARHRLSVEDFHGMGEAGILRQDSRVELTEGELIDMSPIGSVRASVVNRLAQLWDMEFPKSGCWICNP